MATVVVVVEVVVESATVVVVVEVVVESATVVVVVVDDIKVSLFETSLPPQNEMNNIKSTTDLKRSLSDSSLFPYKGISYFNKSISTKCGLGVGLSGFL